MTESDNPRRGWGIVARLPFAPNRATNQFHGTLTDRSNAAPLLGFHFLATLLFALFPTYMAWVKYRSGSFFLGLAIVVAAALINLFLYVLFVDMIADLKLRRKLIFQGLLSAAAISGVFSVLGAGVLEGGVLGLRRSVPALLGALILWQGAVEVANIRRLYGTSLPMAVAVEILTRTLSIGMALAFLGFVAGQARPWRRWDALLQLFR